MDRVTQFREIIKNAITFWADYGTPEEGMENIVAFDEQTDNYVYIYTGWKNGRHIHATIVHIGIRDGKIHVFHDGIEDSIAQDLLDAGVLPSELVIERHPPSVRHLTPYAVA